MSGEGWKALCWFIAAGCHLVLEPCLLGRRSPDDEVLQTDFITRKHDCRNMGQFRTSADLCSAFFHVQILRNAAPLEKARRLSARATVADIPRKSLRSLADRGMRDQSAT